MQRAAGAYASVTLDPAGDVVPGKGTPSSSNECLASYYEDVAIAYVLHDDRAQEIRRKMSRFNSIIDLNLLRPFSGLGTWWKDLREWIICKPTNHHPPR